MAEQVSIFTRLLRVAGWARPAVTTKRANAIRFGILGAARIAPTALLTPAKDFEDVKIVSIGARDLSKAQAFAQKHDIPKFVGSYEEVIDDPDIDAVYIPLPNGKHFEWAIKALRAGKHVLCEKPIASNQHEAQLMVEAAQTSNKILFEAFHYRYHPLLRRIREIIDSGEIGSVKEVFANMQLPWYLTKLGAGDDDIRFNFDLAGGILMDAGCYCVNAVRFASSSEPEKISSAVPTGLVNGNVETGMRATMTMENGVLASIIADFRGGSFDNSLRIVGSLGQISASFFVLPQIYHNLEVSSFADTQSSGDQKQVSVRYEKQYGSGFTSYHYQMEAFIAAVKNGAAFPTTGEDAVKNMKIIDMIYDAAGLPRRGAPNPIA